MLSIFIPALRRPALRRSFPYPVFCLIVLSFTGLIMLSPLAHGEIISARIESVDPEARKIQLRVEGREGSISATAGPGDLLIAREGKQIRAELVTLGGQLHLQNVWPNDQQAFGTIQNLGRQLNRETLERGRRAFRGINERWPRFALFDQNGDLFLSEGLRGNYVLINFIFTRCTVQTMCPAATLRMIETQQLAEERGIKNFQLVSITMDPDYDTPGILAAYGDSRGIDFSNFHFLTGPAPVIKDLTTQMGIMVQEDPEEVLQHTMSTTLVDPIGRIIYRIPGSAWAPDAFIRQIERTRSNDEPES